MAKPVLEIEFPIVTSRGIMTSPTSFIRFVKQGLWFKYCPYRVEIVDRREGVYVFDCDWYLLEGIHEDEKIEDMPYIIFRNRVFTPVYGVPSYPVYLPLQGFYLSHTPEYRECKVLYRHRSKTNILLVMVSPIKVVQKVV